MAQENGDWTDRKDDRERIRGYRLMDDAFMRVVFRGNRKGVAEVLRVILEKEDLDVTNVSTEHTLSNLYGRSVCLDIAATDSEGRAYNIEIQREIAGASPERARLNSSLLDADVARPGEPFENLPETIVIFITEGDVLGGGQALYTINRHIEGEQCRPFGDGSHIVYVNGAMRDGETPLAKLMHDFFCADPDRMYSATLAEAAAYYKNTEEGIQKMFSEIERLRGEGRLEGRKEGRIEEKRDGAARMLGMGRYSIEEVAQVFRLDLDEVRAIAAERGNG